MPNFRLSYSKSPEAEGHSVEFDAPNAGAALGIAFRHAGHRAADLWCDDRMLCRIECPDEAGGFWLIS